MVALLKLRLFAHSCSPRHTPYDKEKKLWLWREGKSLKIYVLLLSPRLKRRISETQGAKSLIDSRFLLPILTVSSFFLLSLLTAHRSLLPFLAISRRFSTQTRNDLFRLFPPLCHQSCIIRQPLRCHYLAWWPQGSGSPR